MILFIYWKKIIYHAQWLTCFFLITFLNLNTSQFSELRAAKKKSRSKVTINLPQTLILKEFIKIISEKTGTVFVYEEKNMRGQMSITAPRNFKVNPQDAFFFFEKILASQGLAMVRKIGSKLSIFCLRCSINNMLRVITS